MYLFNDTLSIPYYPEALNYPEDRADFWIIHGLIIIKYFYEH
jgi:hypothetical protein